MRAKACVLGGLSTAQWDVITLLSCLLHFLIQILGMDRHAPSVFFKPWELGFELWSVMCDPAVNEQPQNCIFNAKKQKCKPTGCWWEEVRCS